MKHSQIENILKVYLLYEKHKPFKIQKMKTVIENSQLGLKCTTPEPERIWTGMRDSPTMKEAEEVWRHTEG